MVKVFLLIWLLIIAGNRNVVVVPKVEINLNKDPTLGYIENRTDNWTIEITINEEIEFTLYPEQRTKLHLDIGKHIIEAEAFVNTVYGVRSVGFFTGKFNVDGRLRYGGVYGRKLFGWRVILQEWGFRRW